MALHSTLTDPYLHEPKGAATASKGDVYVSDGLGSGAWTEPYSGFGFYVDAAAEQTFTTTPAKLSIDGAATNTNIARLPLAIRGIGNLWDTVNDVITPVAQGDAYACRLLLPITARTTAQYANLTLDVGGAAGITNSILNARVDINRTPPFTAHIDVTIFCEATFLANKGQLFLDVDAGSIGITGPSLLISRIHAEV